MHHPTIRLQLTKDQQDYAHINVTCPYITPTHVNVVTDPGAQSCLWSLKDFVRCGFKKSNLFPVKCVLFAANREKIQIDGTVFICLSGQDKNGHTHTTPIMAYISPDTERFYLS